MVQSQLAYGLYMVDLEGRILTWNDGAKAITGFAPGEIIGQPYAVLFDEADVEAGTPDELLETARWTGSVDCDGWRPDKDGHRACVREHLVSINRDDGTSVLVGATLQDQTDQHRYERQLARQNDRLLEFTNITSHDLRNPLGVVSGRIDLARKTGHEEHLVAAEEALARMESYVDDLLVLAKQGRLVGQTESVDLATVARDAWLVGQTESVDLATVARDAWLVVRGRDANARLRLPETPTTVPADRTRLRERLENLFLNAVEHGARRASARDARGDTAGHGSTSSRRFDDDGAARTGRATPSVTVTVGPIEDGFFVVDDGSGFDGETHTHAFDHGFTTSEDGTGFGLSIVETICRAHGWDIVLVETDTGARFEVTGIGPSDHSYPTSGNVGLRSSENTTD